MEFRLIIIYQFLDDGWHLDVEEGFVGQPMTHTRYGPIPFEQLFSVEDDIREMRQREIAGVYQSLVQAAHEMQHDPWEFRL
jgi:hypothetical protein